MLKSLWNYRIALVAFLLVLTQALFGFGSN